MWEWRTFVFHAIWVRISTLTFLSATLLPTTAISGEERCVTMLKTAARETSSQELRTGYSIVTYTHRFKHYSSPAVDWYRGFDVQIKMASVATEMVLLLTSKLLVFKNTEKKVLITSLTFSSDNSKRLARSDIHHEGDGGEGKNLQSLWVGVHVCIKRENICSWLVIHYQRLVCVCIF